MGSILSMLSGKKTYLLLLVYAGLVLFGQAPEGGIQFDASKLQEVVLAAALGTLRAGVAKVSGG